MFVYQCGGVISRGALDYSQCVCLSVRGRRSCVCAVHLCQVVLTNHFYGCFLPCGCHVGEGQAAVEEEDTKEVKKYIYSSCSTLVFPCYSTLSCCYISLHFGGKYCIFIKYDALQTSCFIYSWLHTQ